MQTQESVWYLKFDKVFFLRDANGEILSDDWRWEKVLLWARLELRDDNLALPAEIILRNRSGEEVLIARWDDTEKGGVEEWIASNFRT